MPLTYPTMPGDADHLLDDDHLIVERQFQHLEAGRGDRRVLADQIAFQLALHASAEERVVYPAAADAGLAPAAGHTVDEHQRMKELLVVLNREDPGSTEFEDALARLMRAVRDHVAEEEGALLPQLRERLGAARMAELGRELLHAKRQAPSYAHPHGPSSGLGHTLGDAAAKVVDMVRDVGSGRKPRLATDGSGLLVPDAQAIMDAFSELGPQPFEILTPEQARGQPGPDAAVKRVMEERGIHGPEPVGSVEELDIPDAAGGAQTLRIYRPRTDASGPLPVVMWIHGGGWVLFDLDTYDASCRGLSRRVALGPRQRGDLRRRPGGRHNGRGHLPGAGRAGGAGAVCAGVRLPAHHRRGVRRVDDRRG